MKRKKLPAYVFLAGIILSIVLGLGFTANPYVITLLGLLAVINGLFAAGKIEKKLGLILAMALVVVGVGSIADVFGVIPFAGMYAAAIITNIGVFFGLTGATIVGVIGYNSFSGK